MGRTISKSEYSRQQGASSFRNTVLDKGMTLVIDAVEEYPQPDDNGDARHYVQFSNKGELMRMPLSDASKHVGIMEEYTDPGSGEEMVKFPDKVEVVSATPREVNGETRYPFEAYFLDAAHKKKILSELRSKDLQVDWQAFYFSEDTLAAAKASGKQPVQNYEFKSV
jgi:hypothetical protein